MNFSANISFNNILKTAKFDALVELDLLTIKLSEVDLLNALLNMNNLKSISFTIPKEISQSNLQPRMESFASIENMIIDVDRLSVKSQKFFFAVLVYFSSFIGF